MSCIWTRTTGRTWPNTRLPSRGSNSSLDCHCMKKERSDENVSHRIFTGIDWKHRSRRRPRWIVVALSHREADAERRNQGLEFHHAGFYGQLDGHPPASTEAPLVPMQISPQRLQSIGVKTGKVERKLVADEIRTT